MGSLQKAKTDLASESKILTIQADVTSVADTDAVFKQALEELGHVDVVINTFGALNLGPIGVTDPTAWWQNFEVNVKAVFNVSHSYINAAGGKGTIINMVSLAASFVAPGKSGYSTSKLAAIKLGEYLDVEQPELRVFSVHPGIVAAENGRGSVLEDLLPFSKDTPALTGGLTLYLGTPDADFLKGGYIHANWDVSELEQHKDEILEKKLVKLAFLNGQLQPGGYPWSS
jgi:NAD(P)-dependent dehydrogenase (short-subunit alcohol dehydrogenase family)